MGTSIAAAVRTQYDWTDSPFWTHTVLPMLAVVLVLRLVTLPSLRAGMHGYRARLLSRDRLKQIRTRLAGDASRRQFELTSLRAGYPPRRFAAVLEPVLVVVVGGGLTVLLWIALHHTFTDPGDNADQQALRTSPPWLAGRGLLALFGAERGGFPAALVGLGLAALWAGMWARTRFLVLCTRMPSGTWERSALRRWLVPVLAAQFVLLPLALPNGALLALVLWQGCSLFATRGLNRLPLAAAAPPLVAVATTVDAPAGAVRATYDTVSAGVRDYRDQRREARAAEQARLAREAADRAAAERSAALTAERDAEIARQVLAESEALRAAKEAERAAAAPAAEPVAEPVTVPVTTPLAEPVTEPAGGAGGTVRDTPAPEPADGAFPGFRSDPLPPGSPAEIGDYRLRRRLGKGGYGTVYAATRKGSATLVALKTLQADTGHDEELRARFGREMAALERVPARYTARMVENGFAADGTPFIAMELLDGLPLDHYLRRHGQVRERVLLRALAVALAEALRAVHEVRLVHRDLKPNNVMLTTDGPKLLDFGISLVGDLTRLTRAGWTGTPPFMAPEQFRPGPVGPAADVWAWACSLTCLVHGSSPFGNGGDGNPWVVMQQVLQEEPDRAALGAVRAVDPQLAGVLERALAKEPADRPADGGALLALLGEAGVGMPAGFAWSALGL
ncbi:serine/threonine-protein kinase [Kitasatospora sp. NPDC088134]|uniref:serine/threonine-protein kinase n=1 Tax=Kitasatospora sp. NPDC088134 TaxID=3364071 RepID=UPI003800344B